MQETLVSLVILVVVVLVIVALLRWMGVQIPPIWLQIAGIILGGIGVVIIIRLLWPLLTGGSLRLGMIAPMLAIGVG